MPSALRANAAAGGAVANTIAAFKERNARLGMSPRQLRLNKLWSYYRCEHYENRTTNWDGTKRGDPIEQEVIASLGYIPPGFFDAGGSTSPLPLRFRRPQAPYNLARVIVDRFTGLLFSQQRHPKLTVEDDPETETLLATLAETARLWPQMGTARAFGGAQGTVAAGFSFINGKPVVEIHDTRWCYPDFEDRLNFVLRRFEKRFQYPVDEYDPESGTWEEKPYWYRRVIDKNVDVVYEPTPVGTGEEPLWVEASRVEHKLGFCPVVWVQNLPVLDDIDGDPDCHGIYDLIESHDALVSQSFKSLIANCDPTTVISSEADLKNVNLGSDNALKLPPNSTASYLEHRGDGPKAALELAGKLRDLALEVAQCVLESPGDQTKTATEVMRVYSSMLSKADILREQYGERLVKPLMVMMLRAGAILGRAAPRTDGQAGVQRSGLYVSGELVTIPEEAADAELQLQWPSYFEPSLDDVQKSVTAAGLGVTNKILDREHAVKYIAPYFAIDDVPKLVADLDQKEQQDKQEMMDSMMGAGGGAGGGGGQEEEPPVGGNGATDRETVV